MPNFAGTWKMRSSENFDELLKALGVNAMLRKVAVAAASKPHVEIRQDGDQFYIKTSTTVRTTEINFKVGEGFEEETVDGRKCRSLATWENENKIHCTQTLLEGDGPKTYWTRELANDELILTKLFLQKPFSPGLEKGNAAVGNQKMVPFVPYQAAAGISPETACLPHLTECHREMSGEQMTFGADDVVCTRIYVRE
ncbi:cellular retinoic acid-binding protein 1 isoform X1 [Manis pentadactyla]|uniref:cellular retinoic acid-binding protein 1 isoform X1 n=1 Tax=Manis pentadactyla TaxID=143292 RepID=UPI00255C760B|nr:cellular retinoic acid-binding protein 1 isoform X1 [Manis pentadactyla]